MNWGRRGNVTVGELDWESFVRRFDWRQGEHVSLIGPTGTGKTTLAIQILPKRDYVAAVGTKPADNVLDYLEMMQGYRNVKKLPNAGKPNQNRVIVWPRYRTLNKAAKVRQASTIRKTIDDAYSAGRWCLFVDELAYVTRTLNLRDELVDVWQQGRSVGMSLIGCTQRPRWVPLDAFSAVSHLFLWRTNDQEDIARLAGLNGADSRSVQTIVPQLPRYDVLYVDTRTGSLVLTRPPRLEL